jgi:MoxR-like ATPase
MNYEKNGLRESVLDIYEHIQKNLYFNRPDMEVKGTPFNSALLLSLLTGMCEGNELIIGEPGLGKTTSAEYVSAFLYRFPLATVWASEVPGHPEQTEEKIIGRPDLGRLNLGEEVVIWSNFSLLPVKIIDELNRLPETKQSMILDGVDRGKWEYLNDIIINPEACLFATCNYQDRGTNTIIAPLVDRFDVMVESRHPGANLAYLIGTRRADGLALRCEELELAFKNVLSERVSYQERMQRVEELCERFGEILAKEYGLKTLSGADRQIMRTQHEEIPFDLDANAFLRLIIAELSYCHRYGQKRSNESCHDACHFTGYLCNRVVNCISNRFPSSARKYSQALAWLLGDQEVSVEHLKAVLPFTLAHRIKWKEEIVTEREKAARQDPLDIFMAKEAVNEMHRRYVEQGPELKSALAVACRIAEGEEMESIQGDHPIYWEIRRDLEKEVVNK